ncbi:TPA: stationary phase inducible protein CsiE [Escherichia coli]
MALPVNKRVLKILFILFVVAFCIYLIPRIAINFFYYPDDKIYGPEPWSAESVEFTAKDGTHLQGWFIPSSTGPADNAIATIIHAHGNAGNMSAHWQRRALQPVPPDEPLFMALLFSMLRVPDPLRDAHQRDRQLRKSIKRLVNHFRELGNVRFYDEQGLCDQLYTHLAQALNRSLFAIGIDNTLPEEFARLYPRLVRTTRAALAGFESEYGVHLSDEESGLVAVIFGAWLMQENDLHEKQIILLTGNDSEREAQIEQQLRELTLLPLNIKHMSVKVFLQTGAPRSAALIIAPYTMPLPLFSPPLIYTDLTLTTHQQEQIRKMLESA